MKLYNLIYKSDFELLNFIVNNQIPNSNSVLIQLFYSNQTIEKIYTVIDFLKTTLCSAKFIGTSTAGFITSDGVNDDGILISFSIFQTATVKSVSYCKIDIDTIINYLSQKYISDNTKLVVIFTNTFRFDSTAFLNKFTKRFPNIVIAGGNAGDDFKFQTVFTFSDMCKDCDIAMAFVESANLKIDTKYFFNWTTIGKNMLVTKSKGQTVFEINNQKAINIYERYLGKEIINDFTLYGIEFPLIYKSANTNIARAPISFDQDTGSITFAGEIPKGTSVKFGYANMEYISEQNKLIINQELKDKSDAIFVYSCAARRQVLGSFLNYELLTLNYIAPITGFVTYGEFFHDADCQSNNFLNMTTTCVLISESDQNQTFEIAPQECVRLDKRDIVLKAITTLVSRTGEELEESVYYLEQFKNIVSEASIFSTTDVNGVIKYVNKNFEEISGYESSELLGKTHRLIKHPDTPSKVFNDMWATIKDGRIWKGLITNKRKNGSSYHVLSEIAPIYYKDGSFREYIGIRNDVTELEEYKSILKNELDTTSKSLEESLHYAEQYENAINAATAIIKTDANNIIMYANDKFCKLSEYSKDELIGINCQKLRHPKHQLNKTCDKIRVELANKRITSEVVTNIAKSGKEYVVSNLFYAITDLQGNVREHLQIMHDITEIVNLTNEIADTQKEIVLTLGAIGESRSKETGDHVKRVAEYSYLLAILYGLSEHEANLLRQASPMHDIGKVGIPDSILNKPGALTPQEFDIMKTHAEIGYDMLKYSQRELLQASAIIAYTHHEKWNGLGYPRGLNGEDIPIFGRITSIADVFDALGHDRVYKKAWPLSDIIELLKKERGGSFDPKLIDLFLNNLDQFLTIQNSMQE